MCSSTFIYLYVVILFEITNTHMNWIPNKMPSIPIPITNFLMRIVNIFLQGDGGGRKSGGHIGRRGLTSASFNESSHSGSRIVSNRYEIHFFCRKKGFSHNIICIIFQISFFPQSRYTGQWTQSNTRWS